MDTDIKERIDYEVNKLVLDKWYFMNMEWPIMSYDFNHRTVLKNMKVDLKGIKDILLRQLGYIPVFYFLTILYSNIEYPGPYFELEKGLLL
jgi:hypothetical protein